MAERLAERLADFVTGCETVVAEKRRRSIPHESSATNLSVEAVEGEIVQKERIQK